MTRRFFEILPAASAWITLLGLIFFSWKLPVLVVVFIILFDLFWLLKTVYLFFYLQHSFSKLRKNTAVNWISRLEEEKKGQWEDMWHLVMFPMYKEPYEVVRESFIDLLKTRYPLKKMIVILATEERGGEESAATAQKIKEEFGSRFGHFLTTIHPAGLPGEIQGKGSNETWATKLAKEKIIDAYAIPYKKIIVSVFDVDTRPGNQYFGILTYKFLTVEKPHRSSF